MHRRPLLDLLAAHRPTAADEQRMLFDIIAFAQAQRDCFERSLVLGHVTGSAWVVDTERQHVLLTRHRKLDRWLQPGGHADGDADILRVALREAREESGVPDIRPVSGAIYDVDVHLIPARGTEPEHPHYDIRFLLEADRSIPLVISSESRDLRWVARDDITRLTQDRSILRMLEKMEPV